LIIEFIEHLLLLTRDNYNTFIIIHHPQTLKSKPSKKPRKTFCLLHAGFLLGLLSNPEDGGNMFLQNFSSLSPITQYYIAEDITLQ
jgi:hypothetical protein